ncbi:hypothetical protein H4R33_004457 [Dimargaris cristalligena]|nr:hypothetical protein H4R33_004457 [Dimargaris cristalligena]
MAYLFAPPPLKPFTLRCNITVATLATTNTHPTGGRLAKLQRRHLLDFARSNESLLDNVRLEKSEREQQLAEVTAKISQYETEFAADKEVATS